MTPHKNFWFCFLIYHTSSAGAIALSLWTGNLTTTSQEGMSSCHIDASLQDRCISNCSPFQSAQHSNQVRHRGTNDVTTRSFYHQIAKETVISLKVKKMKFGLCCIPCELCHLSDST
jgi:hypothetical protein